MNKKQAEEEAVKKAKEATHAAGKNTGMSGRDLVRLALCPSNFSLPSPFLFTTLDRKSNRVFFPQFTFNPEWFEEEEEEEEDWDLDKYRKQKEAEDEAAEVERIRLLQIQDGGGE